jgi:undecaprenyl-diphosphatase
VSWRFTRNVLLAFIPSVVIGLAFHDKIEALLSRPDIVAWALIAGGVAILLIERLVREAKVVGVAELPVRTALGVGLIQCIAMIPGVSRSGATIMGALSLGVERRTAAEFSFFLAVPTMMGATTLELLKNSKEIGTALSVGWDVIGVGFLVSFVVAILVIKAFVAIISRSGFGPFAWYRIVAGAAALVWLNLQ